MANKPSESSSTIVTKGHGVRVSRLMLPDSIPDFLGATNIDERHVQGVVPTDKIRDLISVFGLPKPEHMSIPFQKIRQSRGEQFELRIEDVGTHIVDGAPVVGHQWQYRQTLPERTA
jgi:hypothetical protein